RDDGRGEDDLWTPAGGACLQQRAGAVDVDRADACRVALGGDLRGEMQHRFRRGGFYRCRERAAVGEVGDDGRATGWLAPRAPYERLDVVPRGVQLGARDRPEKATGTGHENTHCGASLTSS